MTRRGFDPSGIARYLKTVDKPLEVLKQEQRELDEQLAAAGYVENERGEWVKKDEITSPGVGETTH